MKRHRCSVCKRSTHENELIQYNYKRQCLWCVDDSRIVAGNPPETEASGFTRSAREVARAWSR